MIDQAEISSQVQCSWTVGKVISVTHKSSWQVSDNNAWVKWYKVTAKRSGVVGTKVVAASSLSQVPSLIVDNKSGCSLIGKVLGVEEYTAPVFTDIPSNDPQKWKAVEWKSVPSFSKMEAATTAAEEIASPVQEPDIELKPTVPTLLPDIKTACGCSPTSQTLYFTAELSRLVYLNEFLQRNALKLPDQMTLNYRQESKSWQSQTHFSGQGTNTDKERWDILLDWTCSKDIAGDGWTLLLLMRRRGIQGNKTVTNSVTTVNLPFPKKVNCTATGLDVTARIDLEKSLVTYIDGTSASKAVVNDGIGLFAGGKTSDGHYLLLALTDNTATSTQEKNFSLASYLPAAQV